VKKLVGYLDRQVAAELVLARPGEGEDGFGEWRTALEEYANGVQKKLQALGDEVKRKKQVCVFGGPS
jgi:hypothetical protein